MALADTANLIVSLSLDDRFSGPLNRAQGILTRFGGGMAQSAKGVGQLAVGLGRVGVVAAGAAAGGLITVTRLAGNFEAQLNTINTIAKLNEQDLRGVGEGIRETFRATGQPLNDLTNAYYDLLSAGVKVKDAQLELNTAVRLGIGGLGTTSEAVDLLTTAQNAYGLTAKQTAAASDIFAQAVNDGKVRISEISATFANVAPTARQFGVTIDEIGAAYGFLTAKGVPAAEVTTQMNRAILDLVKPSTDAKKVLEDMGTTGEQLIKKDGLVGALQALRDRADELGVPFQKLFGRIEGFKFALQTTGPAEAGFNRELERMHDSAGQVTAQFEERQKGLNYQLGRLKALALDAGITIGTALLPKIVPLLERLNTFIQDNQDKIQQFGEDLADGFGKFADQVGETDFTNFVNGLKTVASVGGKVVELFLRLPSGVQALIIGGAAINRISGGLVGAGLGNIVGGGIKLLFERGGPGNPMFVTVTNPGFGAGGPGGALGGKGGLLGNVLKVTIIGFAAAALTDLAVQISGINNPIHRNEVDPTRGMRGTNVLADRIAGLERVAAALRDRAAAGDTFAAKQLAVVQAQLDVLRGVSDRVGGVRSSVDTLLPELRDVKSTFADRLAGVRIETIRAAQAAHATQLATDRGFARAAAIEQSIANSSARTAAKDFSPSFSATVNTNVTAYLSTYQAISQISRTSNILVNGSHGSVPLIA